MAGGQGRYTVDVEEDGLDVAGDWFQSRSEHGHLLETIRPTRGRLILVSVNPNPVINSTFEFPLEVLWYRDGDGDLWRTNRVEQGRNITLTQASDVNFKSWLNKERGRFASRNQKRLQMAENRTNYFFASTEEAAGIETLGSINWQQTHTVLTGSIQP